MTALASMEGTARRVVVYQVNETPVVHENEIGFRVAEIGRFFAVKTGGGISTFYNIDYIEKVEIRT